MLPASLGPWLCFWRMLLATLVCSRGCPAGARLPCGGQQAQPGMPRAPPHLSPGGENPSPGERLGKGLPNQPHFISTNTQGTYSMRSSAPYTSGDTSVKETVPALRRDTGAQGQHLKQATDVRADLWESQGLWIFRRGSCHLCRREVRLPDRGCSGCSF